MIKFKQKEYTIQEGHYTGTKYIKKIPGTFKVIAKSVLAGLGIGSVVGAVLPEQTVSDGAKKGAKTGFWAGVALKILIDRFHKPMSSIKFQKIDKSIRKELGFKDFAGMIYNDSKEKRDEFSSYFEFNNISLLDFKISAIVLKKKITIYTINLTKEELNKLNESLDYYCYKYYGMEYSSKLLNQKKNSYSISVIFNRKILYRNCSIIKDQN